MAVYNYTVEGIYETDKGSGKDYTNFKFDIELSRFYPEGAGSHIVRRFLPMLISKQKNKPLFSGIRHWVITNVEKISDEFPLLGKEISEMSEEELQELACMYDIFEIPLPKTMSITEAREKAMLAYMKKVLGAKMDTPEEQEKFDFFKRQEDGTLKLDLGNEKLKVELVNDYKGKKVVEKKLTLADLLKSAGQQLQNGVLALTGKNDNENQNEQKGQDGSFPSANDLTN